MTGQRILAVDPGREKCGLAVLDRDQGVLDRRIVPTDQLAAAVSELIVAHECRVIALGSQTHSAAVRQILAPLLEQKQVDEIATVDEHGSTEEARLRYWKSTPPTGWKRFLPSGLLVPPCAIDDFAAIILGERYFQKMRPTQSDKR